MGQDRDFTDPMHGDDGDGLHATGKQGAAGAPRQDVPSAIPKIYTETERVDYLAAAIWVLSDEFLRQGGQTWADLTEAQREPFRVEALKTVASRSDAKPGIETREEWR